MIHSCQNTLLLLLLIAVTGCQKHYPWKVIPASYVYSIVQRNDSLYVSTRSGTVFRIHPDHPDSIMRLGLPRFLPLRTLMFLGDGTLLAGSYEGGIYRVHPDTLTLLPGAVRASWSMCTDDYDRVWLAGRQGVFIWANDTLIPFSDLREAYDVELYRGRMAIAHRHGITLYDTSRCEAIRTFCRDTICWSIDRFDSLLVCGGVETCLLLTGTTGRVVGVAPRGNIPWSAAMDSSGTVFLATQQGLYRIAPGTVAARCIGYKGKCVKSVHIDHTGSLWVGEYFNRPNTHY